VAFYQPGADRDYIVMQSLDETAYPIVVHEYVHLVLRHASGTFPLWLNEGLAEFFSTVEPEGNRMSVGRVPPGRLEYMTQGVALMELDDLVAITHSSPEYRSRSHAGIFYSESWALTHMLMTDDRYRGKFSQFLPLVTSGASSAEAMATAYGKDIASIGRDLNNYVRQGNYLYYLANYRTPPARRDVPTRRVETFEADLVTANLLGNTRDREAAARAIYERLAGERPDDLQLLEARAYFEMRRGRAQDALPYLARAVERGSTNPSVYRDYAMLEPGRAEELLSKAVLLAPDDAESIVQYATVLLRERKHAEAVAGARFPASQSSTSR
jgi:tetratricopeptide (TPR) repeat protein